MATYIPTTGFLTLDPATIISMDSTSYEQIQQSLTGTTYELLNLYIKADDNSQLFQPFQYQKYNAEGDIEKYNLVIAIDPNQFNPAFNIDLQKKRIVLNGQNTFSFNMLPSQTVFLIFDCIQRQGSDFLPKDNLIDDEFFISAFDEKE